MKTNFGVPLKWLLKTGFTVFFLVSIQCAYFFFISKLVLQCSPFITLCLVSIGMSKNGKKIGVTLIRLHYIKICVITSLL